MKIPYNLKTPVIMGGLMAIVCLSPIFGGCQSKEDRQRKTAIKGLVSFTQEAYDIFSNAPSDSSNDPNYQD